MMKESQYRAGALCAAFVLLAASASAQSGPRNSGGPTSPPLRAESRSHADVVAEAEIREVDSGANAFDLLRRLRPEFLHRKAAPRPSDTEGGYPTVYLDGQRLGGLETLKGIPVSSIVEIRYLRAPAAAEWFGFSLPGGVIAVSTRR